MRFHRAALLLATATLWIAPTISFAKPGDVYRKSGGPKVDVKASRRTPPGIRVCREYRLSARDLGRVQEGHDPQAFDACRRGVHAARRVADDYAASQGLEDGYLRGYAWGLKKGASKGIKDKSAAERAAQAAFDSHELAAEIEKAEELGRTRGKTDALEYARLYFANAFSSQIEPKTKASDHKVQVPAISLYEDAHRKLFGPLPTRTELIKMAAGGERLAIPASDLRSYFRDKTYSISKLYDMNGRYNFDSARATDVEAGWQTWKRGGQDDADGWASLTPAQQKIFETSFRDAYDGYSKYGYAAMFRRALDVGTRDGYKVGKELGTTARYHAALRNAFNKSYAEQVPQRYTKEYETAWADMFERHVAMLKSAPQLTIKSVELVDAVPDGVFSPGERLMVKATVENRGLVKASIPTEVHGPIKSPAPAWIEVPAFRRVDVTSSELASVDPAAPLRRKARFEVFLDKDQHGFDRVIRQVLEIDGMEATEIDPINGNGVLEVAIVNPTTRPSSAKDSVSLVLGRRIVTTAAVPTIDSGKQLTVSLPFEGTDPLVLLGGTAKAGLELRGGKAALQKTSLRLPIDDRETWLLQYFDGLAYGEAVVPSGRNRDDQILRVQDSLVRMGRAEVEHVERRNNDWRSSPRSTLVGRVLEKVATSGSDIRVHYRPLADQLCGMKDDLKGRSRRRSYERLCLRIDRLLQQSEMEGDVPVPAAEDVPDTDPLDDIDSIETSSVPTTRGTGATRH